MKKYRNAIKMLLLAILAMAVGSVWEDAALVSSVAFLVFIFLAVQRAFQASQTFRSKVKLMAVFSALLAVLVVYGLTIMNPPQCPNDYSQQQVSAAHGDCIIGANIGLGIYFMFIVFPAGLLVLILWIRTLLSARKPRE